MPPKYDIAGGVDFYEELKMALTMANPNEQHHDATAVENEIKECLLSKTHLTYGHITLPCSHTFNFLPLYNEVLSQKTNPILLKNIYHIKLNKNHIRCPYCRAIHADVLLPYIVGDRRVTGVNGPSALCMKPLFKCQHVTKKMSGRGSKRHEVVMGCNNTCRDIYYCEVDDDPWFLCKRHRNQHRNTDDDKK